MSKFSVSISFGAAYSFLDFLKDKCYDDILILITDLGKRLQEFKVSDLNKIEFAKDLFEFKINSESLEDCFLKASFDDYSAAINLLNEFQRTVAANVSEYLETEGMCQQILSADDRVFPFKYSYCFDGQCAFSDPSQSVKSYSEVCSNNSKRFPKNIADNIDFTDKARKVFEHIEFHEDFSKTLNTVRLNSFLDYLEIFSHALNTLNQASLRLSSDPSKNDDDLIVIREVSGELGRTLKCSGEAKNKPHFSFPKEENPLEMESVNCEYHLKLDTDKAGRRLPSNYVNRAYFGLKYSSTLCKKKIKLAHLGGHL